MTNTTTYTLRTCTSCDSTATPRMSYDELCCSTCGAEWEYYLGTYEEEQEPAYDCSECHKDIRYADACGHTDMCTSCFEKAYTVCPACDAMHEHGTEDAASIEEDGKCLYCVRWDTRCPDSHVKQGLCWCETCTPIMEGGE